MRQPWKPLPIRPPRAIEKGDSQVIRKPVLTSSSFRRHDLPIVEALQKLITALSSQEPVVLPMDSRKSSLEIVDSWLEHTAAAEYLGVGRSTLYRYSEHHEIESRKFCGRLQYRLSSLEEFKARHVRPARPFHPERSIIPSAPRSGKSEER